MTGKLSEHPDRIWLKLQDVATNDGVEAPSKRDRGGIALDQRNVSTRVRIRSRCCEPQGTRCAVDADDFAE